MMTKGRPRPVVMITGGSSGIGKAAAAHFLLHGWSVAICGRDEPRLQAAVRSMRDQHSAVRVLSAHEVAPVRDESSAESFLTCYVCDVGEPGNVQSLVKAVVDQFGRIDAWCNNAGVAPLAPVTDLEDGQLEETLRVNCAPLFESARELWPVFKDQGGGVIVNVSSLASIDPFDGFSLYGASKAWGNLFTKAIANEGREFGIRTYALCPGAVETPMLRGLFPDFPKEQTESPDVVGRRIWELCQPDAPEESGAVVFVD